METSKFSNIEDIAVAAASMSSVEEMIEFFERENAKLLQPYSKEDLDILINSSAVEITKRNKEFNAQVFRSQLDNSNLSENSMDNLSTAKELVKEFLMKAEPSEVDEAIFIIAEKFEFKPKTKYESILTKFYKEEKRRYDNQNKVNKEYDMDSVSGRAEIVNDFANIYIEEQNQKKRNVVCINEKLRIYKNGIYPDSDEAVSFIKRDIIRIGLEHEVNMTPNLIDQVIQLIEIKRLVKIEDCEPDNEYVLVLNNGLLDIRNWKFEDFDPEKVYFSKIPIDYDPNAAKPVQFHKFFDSCFAGNEKQKDLMQEAFGYTLTKSYKYQVIFYMIGEGGNGKGNMMQILTEMLGIRNISSFSLLQLTDGEHIDYNVAGLHGKHANICGDVAHTKVRNTETLKKLSSNTDYITGRNVREKPFQFINYAKLFFLMNRVPKTDAHTTGDNRRIETINFKNSFSEKQGEIKDIAKTIIEAGEMPGILLWAIEGLKRLEENQKFTENRTIAQRAIEYEKMSNTMRYFIEECIEADHEGFVPREFLLEAYVNFAKKCNGAQLGEKEFKKEFLEECKEAGLGNVFYKQKRLKSLDTPVQDVLKNTFKVKGEKLYCYYGVSLIKNEPQKTIDEYAMSADEKPHVCSGDTEAYELISS